MFGPPVDLVGAGRPPPERQILASEVQFPLTPWGIFLVESYQ